MPGGCVVFTDLMLNVALLRLRSNRLDALLRTFLNSLCSQIRRWIWANHTVCVSLEFRVCPEESVLLLWTLIATDLQGFLENSLR